MSNGFALPTLPALWRSRCSPGATTTSLASSELLDALKPADAHHHAGYGCAGIPPACQPLGQHRRPRPSCCRPIDSGPHRRRSMRSYQVHRVSPRRSSNAQVASSRPTPSTPTGRTGAAGMRHQCEFVVDDHGPDRQKVEQPELTELSSRPGHRPLPRQPTTISALVI